MANTNANVIRYENTTTYLPATSDLGQTTYETDALQRQRRALMNSTVRHWTPDENFSASISSYSNATYLGLSDVKLALDYLLNNIVFDTFIVITGNTILAQVYDNVICDSLTSFSVVLPVATGSGYKLNIKNVNNGLITVDSGSGETIDGDQQKILYRYDCITLIDYTSGKWAIL